MPVHSGPNAYLGEGLLQRASPALRLIAFKAEA